MSFASSSKTFDLGTVQGFLIFTQLLLCVKTAKFFTCTLRNSYNQSHLKVWYNLYTHFTDKKDEEVSSNLAEVLYGIMTSLGMSLETIAI